MAFGVERLDDVAGKLEDVLEMQPPQGLVDKVRGLKKLKSIADSLPKSVSRGASQEIVLTGEDGEPRPPSDPALLARRPGAVHHAAGRDHEGSAHRVSATSACTGCRRSTRARPTCTGRSTRTGAPTIWRPTARSGRRRARPRSRHRPTRERAAAEAHRRVHARRLPARRAGRAGQGEDRRHRRPGNAEIILEGTIEKGEVGLEGPFGDHTGYYTPAEPFPVFRLSAITMRRDAVYPSIVVGKPVQEDAWLGKATERIFLPAIKMTVPEIVDYDLPVSGRVPQLRDRLDQEVVPGHAHKVMHAIWGLGMLSLSKAVVVVDAHVNVHDYNEVFFYVGANVDPKRDVVIAEGPLDHLDHAPTLQFVGGKIGIDATAKGPDEGTREWPERSR
jgi:4-hydroxy-3-polyprenylbenzoate decarboxylase